MDHTDKNSNRIDRFQRNDSELDAYESEDGPAPRKIFNWSESDVKTFRRGLVIAAMFLPIAFLASLFQEKKPELTPQEKAEQVRLDAAYKKRLKYEADVRLRQAEEDVRNPALAEARRRASQPVSIGVAPGPGNTATICASQGDATSCRTIVQGSDGKAHLR